MIVCLLVGCEDNSRDEGRPATKCVEDFLSAINNRNYTLMNNLSMPSFQPFVKFIRGLGDNLIRYKAINPICTLVKGDTAMVNVEIEDMNGFVMMLEWDVRRVNNQWRIFNLVNDFFITDTAKFNSVMDSEKGIYMPTNDPNIIYYSDSDD
ncbi:MAG: hypothetical protein LBL74_04680 [Bacteroidales bacterium]|jgi:hypothetical protein|nr:hypothetical protein [Bacteroidales bacterium]